MRVLAVDTSTRWGAVGLYDDQGPIGEISLLSRESHSSRLLPSIDWMLQTAGLTLQEIDGFGVTIGPGSFTGLRVGLSTVKGLAWSTKKPVVALHSLEILAHNLPDVPSFIAPMLDARKGRVFGAIYCWEKGVLHTVVSPQDIEMVQLLDRDCGTVVCLGDGARKNAATLDALGTNEIHLAPVETDVPRGGVAARLAHQKLLAGELLDIVSAEPIYLRASEQELKERGALT